MFLSSSRFGFRETPRESSLIFFIDHKQAMSEDYDYYTGTGGARRNGKRDAALGAMINITASNLLRRMRWYVDEPPTQARIADFENTFAGGAAECPEFIPLDLYEYELCSGKIYLMLPVLDPVTANCDIVFYEEVQVGGRGSVRLCDVLEAIWKFYNLTDPSDDLVDTLTTILQNKPGPAPVPGAAAAADPARLAIKKFVLGVRMCAKVPMIELLGDTVRFGGLTPWGDGTYFVRLVADDRNNEGRFTDKAARYAGVPLVPFC